MSNPKFIIQDGNLIIGRCMFHKQLSTNTKNVIGGGWYDHNKEDKKFTLFGTSFDFGTASIEDIKNCIELGNVYLSRVAEHKKAKNYSFFYRTIHKEEIIPIGKT